MAQWLFGLIKKNDEDRTPDFARQSHVNWARALDYEIIQEHGPTPEAQWRALTAHFKGSVKSRKLDDDARVGIFEPLFASVTFASSLISLASRGEVEAWECPSATVTWYYATYNAFRSMIAACNQPVEDTHSAAVHALNGGLRRVMPHPFDMVAVREKDQEYADTLPRHRDAHRLGGFASINGAFTEDRAVAQRR
ncbi:MAG: hypothetical protein M3P24_00840 [Gemmatimonadota bacterium]|nr:hypothetical protein [Gemmatimonadota bacterium]